MARRNRDALAAAAGSLATLVVLALPGCQGRIDPMFIQSANTFVNETVGPEYVEYVAADVRLDDEQKAVRLQNVESFRRAVAAARQRPTQE